MDSESFVEMEMDQWAGTHKILIGDSGEIKIIDNWILIELEWDI